MTELTVQEKARQSFLVACDHGFTGTLAHWTKLVQRRELPPGKIRNASFAGTTGYEKMVERGLTLTREQYEMSTEVSETLILWRCHGVNEGDLVVLNSGGPAMLVVDDDFESVTARWHGDEGQDHVFKRETVTKVSYPGNYSYTDLVLQGKRTA